jgi:hypothetical protein
LENGNKIRKDGIYEKRAKPCGCKRERERESYNLEEEKRCRV